MWAKAELVVEGHVEGKKGMARLSGTLFEGVGKILGTHPCPLFCSELTQPKKGKGDRLLKSSSFPRTSICARVLMSLAATFYDFVYLEYILSLLFCFFENAAFAWWAAG